MAQWLKNPPAVQKTQKMWVRPLGQENPLEEGMATHSSTLPGESHGQKSLVGYSPKSLGVRYDWATKHTLLRWKLAFGLRPTSSKMYVPKHRAPCFPQVPPAFKWHHQTWSTLAQNSIPFDSQPEDVPTPTNSRLWLQGWLNSASGRNKWGRF